MWIVLAVVVGLAVGVAEKDNIGKFFDSGIKTIKETSETAIQKAKDITK